MIVRKTARAHVVLSRQDHDLTALQRRILILSDGHRTHRDISRLVGANSEPIIAALAQAGFLSLEPDRPAGDAQPGWLQRLRQGVGGTTRRPARAAPTSHAPVPATRATPPAAEPATRITPAPAPPATTAVRLPTADADTMPFLDAWHEAATSALSGCRDPYLDAFCALACTSTSPDELRSFLKGMLVYLGASHPALVQAFLQGIAAHMPETIHAHVQSTWTAMAQAA